MIKAFGLLIVSLLIVGCGSNDQPAENQDSVSSYQKPAQVDQLAGKAQDPQLEKRKEELKKEGMDHLSKAEVNEAINKFVEIVKLDPTDLQTYFILVQTYIRLQSYDNALAVLDTILKMDPNNGNAYYLRAVTFGLTGKKDAAIESAQKSVELFQSQRNEESFKKSIVLLQSLVDQGAGVGPKDVSATTTNPQK